MNISKQQNDESELEVHARDLKARSEYPTLKKYLIQVIASGRLTARLQAGAYFELGLAHLHLGESAEAAKAFRSATERDAGAAGPLSTGTEM